MSRVLLVDDEKNLLDVLAYQLADLGHKVSTADNVDSALEIAASDLPEIIITDLKMPGKDGFFLIGELKKTRHPARIIVLTAFASIETAVKAIKSGADDYLTKPVNQDELALLLEKHHKQIELEKENAFLRRRIKGDVFFEDIPGNDPGFKKALATAYKAATSEAPILIHGESGTGKELVARAIHNQSNRKTKPFIALNCAAISGPLFESELFGYKKGAFTGAGRDKPGLLEEADSGTLFLDEIAEMPMEQQAKLLRFLENGTYRRVGETTERSCSIRLISASNKNLEEEIRDGRFREDLYFRISVFPILLPPLREREIDIPLLAHIFLKQENPESNLKFTPEFLDGLTTLPYPGNIRELKNIISRAAILSEKTIDIDCLPGFSKAEKNVPDSKSKREPLLDFTKEEFDLAGFEVDIIQKSLTHFKNNITRTAKFLKIPRHKLIYRLKQIREEDK